MCSSDLLRKIILTEGARCPSESYSRFLKFEWLVKSKNDYRINTSVISNELNASRTLKKFNLDSEGEKKFVYKSDGF